jgi:tetratricopeptide (TPR) repeat protein
MQDEVARDIVHEIVETLHPASYGTHEQRVNPEAYDQYLHGRFLWNRRTLGDLEKSIDYYRQAIQLAPDFAPAYVALGNAYAVISIRGGPPPSVSYPRAREAAEKALQLDASLAEAHALLGEVKVNYDHDWDGGEKEFRQAVELNPNYATAHQWYAEYLASMKRLQEAQAEIDKAAMLDPLSLIINATRGETRYLARDPNSAIKVCLHAQELYPNFAEIYLCLGKAYEQQKQFSEADSSFKRAADLSVGNPGPLLMQAHAYALSGRKDLATVAIDRSFSSKHGYISNSDVAAVYCAMGQPSQATAWLEKANVNREEGLNRLAVEPLFDGCRQDPRFQALIRQLGLPQ